MPARPFLRSPSATASRGVSLIELLVGIAIIGMAVALGAPSFSEGFYNSQIRSTAESIQNGLQFARAEAVRRNTAVRMQLTTSLDNTCTISASGTSWVVSLASAGTPESKCGDSDTVLQSGQPVSGKASATVSSDPAATFGFNGLGRIVKTTSPDTDILDGALDIKPSKGTCAAESGGTLRCLRVLVSAGGQVRMCDPQRGGGDPMACPP